MNQNPYQIPVKVLDSWRYGIVNIEYDETNHATVRTITPKWLSEPEAEALLAQLRQDDPTGDYDLIVEGAK